MCIFWTTFSSLVQGLSFILGKKLRGEECIPFLALLEASSQYLTIVFLFTQYSGGRYWMHSQSAEGFWQRWKIQVLIYPGFCHSQTIFPLQIKLCVFAECLFFFKSLRIFSLKTHQHFSSKQRSSVCRTKLYIYVSMPPMFNLYQDGRLEGL